MHTQMSPSVPTTHSRRTTARATTAVVLTMTAALAFPTAAHAHVSLDSSTTAVGGYATLDFGIGHGCDGSPTTALTVEFPEAITSVKPYAKAGWSVTSNTPEDGPITVTFTAEDPLPDELRDVVSVAALLPLDGTAGDTLAFPVTQTCTEGEHAWDQPMQGDVEPEYPAPTLTLTAAEASAGSGEHAGHGGAGDAAGDAETAPTDEHSHGAPEASAADAQARAIGTGGLIMGALGVALATLSLRRMQGGRR